MIRSPETLSRWAEEVNNKIKDFVNSHPPIRWHGECRFNNEHIYVQFVLQPHPSRRRNTEGIHSLHFSFMNESQGALFIEAVAKVSEREIDLVNEMTIWLEKTVGWYGMQPVLLSRDYGGLGEVGVYRYYLE